MRLCTKDLSGFPMIAPNEQIHYITAENSFLKQSCSRHMKGNPRERDRQTAKSSKKRFE